MFLYFLDLFGTAVFAISGVTLAFRLRMDAIGVLILASVVAIGGGTLRDVILDVPVFWLKDNNYIWDILITCVISATMMNYARAIPWWILPISDALGLGVFTIIGADTALSLGLSATVAVIMGTLTACGGGIIRDMLARRIPFVLRQEIYASACIVGGSCYAMLRDYWHEDMAIIVSVFVVLAIRIPAIIWRWSLPKFDFQG